MLFALLAVLAPPPDFPRHDHSDFARRLPDDRIRHFECFNLVRVIQRETAAGKTELDVTNSLSTHCDRLDDIRKNICIAIVPGQVPKIVELLGEKKTPDVICESLGFTRTFGAGRVIPRDQCTSNVELIRKEYAKLAPEEKAGLNGRPPIDRERLREDRPDRLIRDKLAGLREDTPDRLRDDRLERPPPPDLNGPGDSPGQLKERLRRIREQSLPGDRPGPLGRDREGLRRLDRGRFPPGMRGSAVCKDLGQEERMVCEIISRLVLRGMTDDLESGLSSADICKKLEDRHLIKLTDAAP
jgi:hypothetical protein